MAGTIPGLLPIGAIILTPLFGSLYDRIGKGSHADDIGSVMLIFVHTMFALPILNIWWFATVIMIIWICLLVGSFSYVAFCSEDYSGETVGNGLCIDFWVQNWGLMGAFVDRMGVESYCKGPVVDGAQTYDYTLPMAIFAMFRCTCLIVALMLKGRKQEGKSGRAIQK